MNGLSSMKRTASTSSSILAVSSAITFLSGNPRPIVMVDTILTSHDLIRKPVPALRDHAPQIRHSSPRLRPWNVLMNRSSAVQRRLVSPCSCE